ncbi:hypothetical protein [Pseudomonas putida]|uniref:hypothetical protein n=1 Tax=Pseudomonas putida TaxID=303 RepID=UPI003D95B374
MTEPSNLYANWPVHHLMFVALRDGGDAPEQLAPTVATFHGISVEELKAQCRRSGEEWITRDGGLGEINQRVYDWAKG